MRYNISLKIETKNIKENYYSIIYLIYIFIWRKINISLRTIVSEHICRNFTKIFYITKKIFLFWRASSPFWPSMSEANRPKWAGWEEKRHPYIPDREISKPILPYGSFFYFFDDHEDDDHRFWQNPSDFFYQR